MTRKRIFTDEERKLKIKERGKIYNSKPENKEKARMRALTPEYKKKIKEYYSKPENKEKQKERQKEMLQNPVLYQKHKEAVARQYKKISAIAKIQVFTHYSKLVSNSDVPICACCKYDDLRFLALDHIDGRKNVSEKEKRLISYQLWKYIIKQGFPEKYQILCHNCNIAKGPRQYCPHQLDRMKK